MRIAEVGSNRYSGYADNLDFNSTKTLIDYDAVIIDLRPILSEYTRPHRAELGVINNIVLNEGAYDIMISDIRRRDEEIKTLLRLGRCVFVHLPPPITFSTNKNVSGTLFDYFTFAKISTVSASGSNIEFKGEGIFTDFWKENKQNFEYNAYFRETIGKPLFYIGKTDFVVASYLKQGKGHLIFLPYINIYNRRGIKDYDPIEHFINSLPNLIENLEEQDAKKMELPAWSKQYKLPHEDTKNKELTQLQEDLNQLQQKINETKHEIEKIDNLKTLFAGTGKLLEIEVKRIFEELGFSTEELRPNRDDLIIKYNDRVAVVEIKGVKNSAAEKHAAQLEKWVSEYYEVNDVKPKGILIVNTYNDKPLKERTEASFPNQMQPFSIAREHCLITGLQLLSLYLDCKDNEERRKTMIDFLFSTRRA